MPLLALGLASALNLIFPWAVRESFSEQSVFNIFVSPQNTALLFIGIFSLQGIFYFFRVFLFGAFGLKISQHLRSLIFSSLLQKPVATFDNTSPGELLSSLLNDTTIVQEAISQKLSLVIRYSIQAVFGVAAMLWLSTKLSLMVCLTLPLIIFLAVALGRGLKKLTKHAQEALGKTQGVALEYLLQIKVIKAFGAEKIAGDKFGAGISHFVKIGSKRLYLSAIMQSLITALINIVLAALFIYGITQVSSGSLRLEDFIAFTLYGFMVAVSMAFLANGSADLIQASGALERIHQKLNDEVGTLTVAGHSSVEERESQRRPSLTSGIAEFKRIAFENISFSYPSRPEVAVLQNFNLAFGKNEALAIVGPSGVGKTALLNLLLGFYPPTSGQILFNGEPINITQLKDLRQQIGYVPQEAALFQGSLRENLMLGAPKATDAELWDAVKRVNLADAITTWPNQLDTELGSLGTQLSGGQKQRLCIARALLRSPQILVLDEPTSALDQENEKNITELVKELRGSLTVVVVTHREQILEAVDRVVRLG
jgi:ATP-binding cassette subfamily B protein